MTPRTGLRPHRWASILTACAFACAALHWPAFAIAAVPQEALTIPQQRQVLFDSVQEVFAKYSRELGPSGAAEVAKLKMLGVGSWQYSDAAKDIDVTFAHPDKALERRLVDDINKSVAARTGSSPHQIKAIVEKDPKFAELFRGDVGEAFVLDYANKSGGGEACYSWSMDESGQVVRKRSDTLRFWKDRGLDPPEALTSPFRFVEDNRIFAGEAVASALAKSGDVDGLIQGATSVAKYTNNVDGWLKGRLADTYGDAAVSRLALDPDLAEQVALLRKIKDQSPARQKELLKEFYRVSDEADLSVRLKELVTRSYDYLETSVDKVAIVDYLAKSGTLPKVKDLSQAFKLKDALYRSLRQYGVDIGVGAVSLYFIVDQYYTNGVTGAVIETMNTLITLGVPETAVPALVASIAKEAFTYAGIEAGNYLIFDAINDAALQGAYNPERSWCVFTWDESPFKGTTRETLYYKFPYASIRDAENRFSFFVDQYLERVSSLKGGLAEAPRFATEGAGSFRPVLLAALLKDWAASRQVGLAIQAQEAKLSAGTVIAASRPLRISVDGSPIEPARQTVVTKTAGPSRTVDFAIDVEREFSVIRALRLPAGTTLFDTWGQKGAAALKPLVDKYLGDRFLYGSAPLQVSVHVSGAKGWRLDGRWPVMPALLAGEGAADGTVSIPNATLQPFQDRSYRIRLTADPQADTTVGVALRVSFKEELSPIEAPPIGYQILLTARPPATVTETASPNLSDALEKATKKVEAERKAAPTPPAKAAEIEPQAACDCVGRWQTTIYQSTLLADCRSVEGSACLAFEVRITKPWTYDAAKNVCVGSFSQVRQLFNATTRAPYWNQQGGGTDAEVSLAHARQRCKELGEAPAIKKPN